MLQKTHLEEWKRRLDETLTRFVQHRGLGEIDVIELIALSLKNPDAAVVLSELEEIDPTCRSFRWMLLNQLECHWSEYSLPGIEYKLRSTFVDAQEPVEYSVN